ncbi:TerC family protein [Ktedonobacter racemifer]|uniref:Integral membrane protein TerC n=1 Tax=Ktedonobacter racemifer DSM 44963 TaxID=485913 RepID=D6U2U4_KTERA|nr:TerC family protein [Ktedonobacter racemifer]EFH82849.1 Integral membrane protein TerC [Ktedonobacter racemifer DSM 44963]
MTISIWFWIGFNVFVLAMLALDLGIFNRKEHIPSIKEALIWVVVWVLLALIFNVGVYFFLGTNKALEFLAGYLIEQSLSTDNIFVFVLIFSYFVVPRIYQHRVLFWGIMGALIMRGTMIAAGAFLLERFHWILYIFGAFLIYTGIRMAFYDESDIEPEKNPVLRLARRIFPIASDHEGKEFLIRRNGTLYATPLLLVLIVVETTDLIFAVDSIPAVFAITQDPFIVYTSNVFAILGLRSLYFVLANLVDKFYYLRFALAVILSFVGIKMLLPLIFHDLHVPTWFPLVVIVAVLLVAVIASVVRNRLQVK